MASVRVELTVPVKSDLIWDVFKDIGAVHTRLARGFVTDCRPEGDARVVTFANGMVAREVIVDIDDARKRLAYTVAGSPRLTHHNASFQLFPDGEGTRIVWITDLLPHSAADGMRGMMEAGAEAMRATLTADLTQSA